MKRTRKSNHSTYGSTAPVEPANSFAGNTPRAGSARTAADHNSEALLHVVNAVAAMEETCPGIAAAYDSGLQILEEVCGLCGHSPLATGSSTRGRLMLWKARTGLRAAREGK